MIFFVENPRFKFEKNPIYKTHVKKRKYPIYKTQIKIKENISFIKLK
jgi:hypothetical protein